MARWLRRACRAMHRSQGVPSYSWSIVKWCPRLLRMRAQRRAVTRLPLRERGGAGQAMKILMRRLYSAWKPPCEGRQGDKGPEHQGQMAREHSDSTMSSGLCYPRTDFKTAERNYYEAPRHLDSV